VVVILNFTCPCCGYKTLHDKGEYSICPICFWEDDFYQEQNPYSPDGANHISLLEGQINYRKFGACDNNCLNSVRKANITDEYDTNWIPLITPNQAFLEWINKQKLFWEKHDIVTEDVKIATDEITDNPNVTVYHYNQKNKIGVITVWENNMFYYEVEDCSNGHTLLVKNYLLETPPVFEEILNSYFTLMSNNTKINTL
jgi:hypothetical protein